VVGLDDLHDQLDQGGGSEKLAAALPLAHGEPAQEVLVDLAKHVALDVHLDAVKLFEQGGQGVVAQAVVGLGQHVLEVGVVLFDGLHGVVDGPPDVLTLGQLHQVLKAGLVGQVEDAASVVVVRGDGTLAVRGDLSTFGLDLPVGLGELVVGVAQEDQAQHRDRVFGRFEPRIGTQLIGRIPETLFDLGVVGRHSDTSLL